METEEIKKLIASNVTLYNTCLQEVSKKVDPLAFGETLPMTAGDLKDIASSIFIETNKQMRGEEKKTELRTPAQMKFIEDLIEQKGARGRSLANKYIEELSKEPDELTVQEASDLITALKKL